MHPHFGRGGVYLGVEGHIPLKIYSFFYIKLNKALPLKKKLHIIKYKEFSTQKKLALSI